MDVEQAGSLAEDVVDEVADAVVADREFFESVMTAVVAGGHVLIEDVPGTGKTLTARCFADALGLSFSRVQFTPDLLPNEVVGSYVYDEDEGEFEFREGPVFANVVLADEINRAPPKTQAALLETMEEKQVTVDGVTHALPEPFYVLATQNPVEQEGTFPLPEAQKDRFWLKEAIGYPDDGEDEYGILRRRGERRSTAPSVEAVVDDGDVDELMDAAESVEVERDVGVYMTEVTRRTREHPDVELGCSPRASQRLYEVSRAYAVVQGRSYVVPQDVKDVAEPALAHRLILTSDARLQDVAPEDVVDDVLEEVPVPTV